MRLKRSLCTGIKVLLTHVFTDLKAMCQKRFPDWLFNHKNARLAVATLPNLGSLDDLNTEGKVGLVERSFSSVLSQRSFSFLNDGLH